MDAKIVYLIMLIRDGFQLQNLQIYQLSQVLSIVRNVLNLKCVMSAVQRMQVFVQLVFHNLTQEDLAVTILTFNSF